jgi:PAS domain S-box-containing protein
MNMKFLPDTEMGNLIREKAWEKTSLGAIQSWPENLHNSLSIMMNSRFPMFLFWGKDLISFYNDAYRPSFGNEGMHPAMLGKPAEEAWADIWHIVKKFPEQVLSTGIATWEENQLIPIYRNGKTEDVYWTFSHSPVYNTAGTIEGIFVLCMETTQEVLQQKKITESEERYHQLIANAPVAMCLLRGRTFVVELANERMLELWGKQEIEVMNKPLFEGLPEVKGQGFDVMLEGVFTTGVPVIANEQLADLPRNGKIERTYVNFVYEALKDIEGSISAIVVVAVEVTQQVIARNKIEESQKQFSTLADNISQLTWMANADGYIYWYNKQWYDYTGTTPEQMEGWGWQSVHDPKVLPIVIEVWKKALTNGTPFEMTFPLKGADGSFRKFLTRVLPLKDSEGKIQQWFGTNTDISEQLESQALLEYRKKLLEAHDEASFDGLMLVDAKGKILSFNKRFIEIWNMPQHIVDAQDDEAALDFAMTQLVNPQQFIEKVKYLYEHPTETSTDLLEYKDGKIIERHGYPVVTEDGSYYAWSWTFRDITFQFKAEKALKESEEKFRLLADSMPQHIWTSDTEGNLNYFNQSVFDYSGLTLEKINKDGWLQIVHPDEREENAKKWIHSVQTGETFHFEHRFRRHDGEYKWQLSRAIPQRNSEGKIQMWVGTSTEIQQQKEIREQLEESVIERTQELLRANDELEEKNHELEKTNKELESFTYISSHDLQEPLRKIQTFSTRISEYEENNLSDSGKDMLNRMKKAANRMQMLIQDLLAYSRTTTTEQKFETIDLNKVIAEVKEDLREELNEKHGAIEADQLCDVKVIPFQFRQLMHNLVGNSLKFSKVDSAPRIQIRSEIADGITFRNQKLSPQNKYCHITVSDNGIGFDQQYSEKIFEVFQRLHGKEEYNGTGIGLSIVKKIVENHNGVITASGELNKGATFDIYIPAT